MLVVLQMCSLYQKELEGMRKRVGTGLWRWERKMIDEYLSRASFYLSTLNTGLHVAFRCLTTGIRYKYPSACFSFATH